MAEATRAMCTPVGLAATRETNLVVPSVTSSCNSPQLGMIVARSPRLLLSRSVAANVLSVDCPLACSACPSVRTTSDCSSRFIAGLGNAPESIQQEDHRDHNARDQNSVSRKSFHHKTSKFVSGPQGQVVKVSPRGCIFQELAGVKNTVIRLKVSVTINLPTNFHSGPITAKASPSAVGRHQQKTMHRVNP